MKHDTIAVIDRFYEAWLRRDLAGVGATLSPLVRLSQHFADPSLPFTGTTIGKSAFLARLEIIYRDWHFDHAEPRHDRVVGNRVLTNCRFEMRHIDSGAMFDGTFRHEWSIADGLIAHIDEQLDVARLRAFLRLIEARNNF